MDYLAKMRVVLHYVEAHLHEDMTMEDVAEVAGFSPYHFHRLFTSIIGESLMTYIRKRRFARATFDLIHTEKRILDIALESGFESQESFTRSFKKQLGVTPGRYRRGGRHYAVYQPQLPEQNTTLGGIGMEANIVKKSEFYVIGMEITDLEVTGENEADANGDRIPQLWDQFNPRIEEIKNRNDLTTAYGICFPTDGTHFRYMCAVEVSSLEDVPAGMVARTIPAQQYAIFTHRGPVWKIKDTSKQIYGEWLPQTGYEFAMAPDLEIYDARFKGPAEDSEMDICVPIK